MSTPHRTARRPFLPYEERHLARLEPLRRMDPERLLAMRAVAAVFPFRTNNYVIEDLIWWAGVPRDPMFQLTFPQPDMLEPEDLSRMTGLLRSGAHPEAVRQAAREIQRKLNPHPAGQMEHNVPSLGGKPLRGLQHKYRETVLFFPTQGQTCFAYCTYCFRWPQFVGLDDLKFAANEVRPLVEYLRQHREVTNVLITGGDPLIMRAALLKKYIEPLLAPELAHVTGIRIGTKAPAYWPYRFLTDPDADDLLRLFERVRTSGRHLAVMAHYSHPRELETPVAQAALRRIIATGAVVRCQAPLIRHVNDYSEAWAELWRLEVALGAVPYYMFVERDTGPRRYFEVPLARGARIYREAFRQVSGLARTVRGPSMSATPGKVVIDGVATVGGERVFALRFLQARNPDWVGRPFFARYDEHAVWFDDLRPAFGESRFFFETPNLRDGANTIRVFPAGGAFGRNPPVIHAEAAMA